MKISLKIFGMILDNCLKIANLSIKIQRLELESHVILSDALHITFIKIGTKNNN